tara:strand:+ start:283 stop:1278 length:996 start_codon:yes stop_codon:yes gene_type:complete
MSRVINVVVTCTDSKTLTNELLQLRNYTSSDLITRFQAWKKALNSAIDDNSIEHKAAVDVYKGSIWSTVKRFDSVAKENKLQIKLWICSAGYGLISDQAKISGYKATFARSQDDSVARDILSTSKSLIEKAWWNELTKWDGPENGEPRSITAIVEKFPDNILLVVCSSSYLNAIYDDLVTAQKLLNCTDNLIIICAGKEKVKGLSENMLPCDGRFQELLGGTRGASNVRLAEKILSEEHFDNINASKLIKKYGELLEQQPPIKKFNRKKIPEQEIKEYIRKNLEKNPNLSATKLLRQYRDDGFQCEQKRFRDLFNSVNEKNLNLDITDKSF